MKYGRSLCIHACTKCATVGCVVCCGVVLSFGVKLKTLRETLNTLLRHWLTADHSIKIGFTTLLEEKLTVFFERWNLCCSRSFHRCNFLVVISKPMYIKKDFILPWDACLVSPSFMFENVWNHTWELSFWGWIYSNECLFFFWMLWSVRFENHIITKMRIFVHFAGAVWWNSLVIQST